MKRKGQMDIAGLGKVAMGLLFAFLMVSVGVLLLDKFAQTTGVTDAAELSLNNGRDALASFNTDWGSLIVLFIAIGILITIVVGSVMYFRSR